MHRRSRVFALSLLLAGTAASAAWFLPGCGGGGSSGGGGAPASSTGTVAVLLADGPADEYDSIVLEIEQIALISAAPANRPPFVLFERDGFEVDILDLRSEDLVLTVRENVPPGTYEKVRLVVSEIRSEGGPCDDLRIRLPSGKIDLVPRGPIRVVAGETLFVRLDIDANRSLHLHEAGSSGQCIFRPVVFVTIDSRPPATPCLRGIDGTVLAIEDVDAADGDGGGDEGDAAAIARILLQLPDGRGILTVLVDSRTSIFDGSGMPAGLDALEEGDRVRVHGRLDERGRVRARSIAWGEVLVVEGTAQGPVVEGLFTLRPDAGEEVVGDIDATVFDATVLLEGCDEEVEAAAIGVGTRLRVEGKLAGGALVSFARLLARDVLAGELVGPPAQQEGGLVLTIEIEGGDPAEQRHLLVPNGVPIELESFGEVSLALIVELLGCRRLDVRVMLSPGDPGVASEVVLEADSEGGRIAAVSLVDRTIRLDDGTLIRVAEDARIFDLRRGDDHAMELGQVMAGARAHFSGLEACDGDPTSFVAFGVFLIEED